MTSNEYIDRLERELRAASHRRVRLELARVPRMPAGVTLVAIAVAICVAVALPLLAVSTRSAGHPGPSSAGGRSSAVVSCGDAVIGQLSPGWRGASSTVAAGPVAWPYLLNDFVRASITRSHFVKGLAVLDGEQATVAVPRRERHRLSLDYTSVAPRSRFYVSQGTNSVTFRPCSGRRQTQFVGGFIVARPQCAEVEVRSPASAAPISVFIPLGRSCSAGRSALVLKGDGIGAAVFGDTLTAATRKIGAPLGQPPARISRGPSMCGIDRTVFWPGLAVLFHGHRFVGYSYGSTRNEGIQRQFTSARGLRVGDTVAEGERLYGHAFRVSPAQGGSFSVRTPQGVIDGFLSDVTNPHGKVLTIEAGNVGCPAMTP